jgi:hypothetical protein
VISINQNTGAALVVGVGSTTIKYTVGGGCATATKNVTVSADIQAPTITCCGNITESATGTNCSKSISLTNPTTSDNCAVVTLTWQMTGATTLSSPNTGINYVGTQTFNVGTTTITYTAKDAAGNSSSCSFTVIVKNSNCHGYAIVADKPLQQPFSVQIMNNPSLFGTDFILTTKGGAEEPITIVVMNMLGKKVYQTKGMTTQTYRFGAHFISGVYIVEVLHGNETSTYKIVKGG